MSTPARKPDPNKLTAEESEVIIITRQDVATRQLDTAIWLWFLEKDPVSIHALADNALTVLHGVGSKTGKSSHFYSRETHKVVGRKRLKMASVFFKHASKDPNDALKFPPGQTEFLLFDAINLYSKVYGRVTLFMKTFAACFVISQRAKGRLGTKEIEMMLPDGVLIEELIPLSRGEFFEKVLLLFAKGG